MEVVSEADEQELARAIRGYSKSPMTLHDNPSRRQVAHFGVAYSAGSSSIQGSAPDIPDLLNRVIAMAAGALDAADMQFDEVLVTEYPPGAGIGRHRDAPAFGAVLGISLLNACDLQFERGVGTERQVCEQLLPQRSAYLLGGAARWVG